MEEGLSGGGDPGDGMIGLVKNLVDVDQCFSDFLENKDELDTDDSKERSKNDDDNDKEGLSEGEHDWV